tara:strand:- start:470 stop:895 length:426 start_codon:yes stop_codon:yes gene_type:complete
MVIIIIVLVLDVLVRLEIVDMSTFSRSKQTVSESTEPPPSLPELVSSLRVFEVLETDPENEERFIVYELDSDAKKANGPVYVSTDEDLDDGGFSLFITDTAAEEFPRDALEVGMILEVSEYFVAQNGVVAQSLKPIELESE